MTDITELAQSLKAAAENAGIEQWVNNRGEVNTADYEVDDGVYIDHICDCEIIGTESPRAEFIALASPANVLALVEALEKAQADITKERDLRVSAENLACELSVAELVTELETAQQVDYELCKLLPSGVEYMDPPDGGDVTPLEGVRRMVADYRQRIAELESRTVTPVTYSENTDADHCRKWGWEQVKGEVSTEGWTTGDNITYFGFFCWGWDMRRQYNEQRTVTVKIPYLPDDCDRTEAHFKYQAALTAAGIKWEAE